ncbi:hypothetical protein DPMN_002366 [Dreissena polymorpha]|uniref:Uncharacterized protein n=1 Tax=Dreissena polymorpha TaxID=45954 RepID=A0A9D4MLU3_DREPO|nr:hypothetical protein DPMN_002366 [Dreissena polymorpha]
MYVCIWSIKSHSQLTGCDLTNTQWPVSSTPVTHHLVLLDIHIIVVYNQDLSVRENTDGWDTAFM